MSLTNKPARDIVYASLMIDGVRRPVTAAVIREMRMRAGLNQQEAAAVVHRSRASRWHEWETGKCVMPLAELELFLLKTGQHKEFWK